MNNITVNGKSYICSGKNIVVRNGKVIVDGELIEEGLSGNVHIHFNGDLASLDCTDATISGNVMGDVNATSLRCNDINGNVDATSVKCNIVTGKVDAVSVKMKK